MLRPALRRSALAIGALGGLLVPTTAALADAPTFAPRQDLPTIVGLTTPQQVAACDMNNDGRVDLAVTHWPDNAHGDIVLLAQKADGGFEAPLTLTSGTAEATNVICQDVTGDGRNDIAATFGAGVGGDQFSVIPGTVVGPGPRLDRPVYGAGQPAAPYSPVVLDVNGDGKLDVAVSDRLFDTPISLFQANPARDLNNPATSFLPAAPLTVPTTAGSPSSNNRPCMTAGDFDGDGRPDLVAWDIARQGYALLRNTGVYTGATTTWFALKSPVAGFEVGCPAILDVDGDGRNDIVFAEETPRTNLAVYLNRGTGSDGFPILELHEVAAVSGTFLATGDVDGDGHADVAVASYPTPSGVRLLPGTGDATLFGAPVTLATDSQSSSVRAGSVRIADVDGDGRLDVLIVQVAAGTVAYYRNTTPQVAVTGDASDIARRAATVAGSINPRGMALTYHFEYGPTTAYGAATAETAGGSARGVSGVSAALGGLAPATTYHYRLVTTTVGGAVAGGDRVLTTPGPSLAPAAGAVTGTWRVSRFTGKLTLTGTASDPTALTLTLRRGTTTVGAWTAAVAAGAFTVEEKLRGLVVPGADALDVAGTADGVTFAATTLPVRVPAPREGVVSLAYASNRLAGKSKTTLHHPARIFAIFAFAAQPRNGRLSATWTSTRSRRSRVFQLFAARRVASSLVVPRGVAAWPPGRYKCTLRSAGKVIAIVSVKVT